MEASLLPSQALRTLCQEVVVALHRRDGAEAAELRREFAIPFLNSWVVVLDGKGETLASWVGDIAGAGCNKRSVKTFPNNLVRTVRASLDRNESVEEAERRWRARPRDMALFDRFERRLEEMHAYAKLRRLCEGAARDTRFTQAQRDCFRIRAFVARASDHAESLSTRRDRARFVADGEGLLVELATDPQAADLVGALFSRGYAHTFDVPRHSALAIARLEGAARSAAGGRALKKHIGKLAEMRASWVTATNEALGRTGDTVGKQYLAALLGDARAAIKLCSRPPYNAYPEYRSWLVEAKRKLERERTCAR